MRMGLGENGHGAVQVGGGGHGAIVVLESPRRGVPVIRSAPQQHPGRRGRAAERGHGGQRRPEAVPAEEGRGGRLRKLLGDDAQSGVPRPAQLREELLDVRVRQRLVIDADPHHRARGRVAPLDVAGAAGSQVDAGQSDELNRQHPGGLEPDQRDGAQHRLGEDELDNMPRKNSGGGEGGSPGDGVVRRRAPEDAVPGAGRIGGGVGIGIGLGAGGSLGEGDRRGTGGGDDHDAARVATGAKALDDAVGLPRAALPPQEARPPALHPRAAPAGHARVVIDAVVDDGDDRSVLDRVGGGPVRQPLGVHRRGAPVEHPVGDRAPWKVAHRRDPRWGLRTGRGEQVVGDVVLAEEGGELLRRRRQADDERLPRVEVDDGAGGQAGNGRVIEHEGAQGGEEEVLHQGPRPRLGVVAAQGDGVAVPVLLAEPHRAVSERPQASAFKGTRSESEQGPRARPPPRPVSTGRPARVDGDAAVVLRMGEDPAARSAGNGRTGGAIREENGFPVLDNPQVSARHRGGDGVAAEAVVGDCPVPEQVHAGPGEGAVRGRLEHGPRAAAGVHKRTDMYSVQAASQPPGRRVRRRGLPDCPEFLRHDGRPSAPARAGDRGGRGDRRNREERRERMGVSRPSSMR